MDEVTHRARLLHKGYSRIPADWITSLEASRVPPTLWKPFEVAVREASFGGAFLETARALCVGDLVDFAFRVPGKPDTHFAKGVVVRKEANGVAVQLYWLSRPTEPLAGEPAGEH
ncbi:MAG: hypothetical protein AB7O52_01285 [Planctomycetota bacterium]